MYSLRAIWRLFVLVNVFLAVPTDQNTLGCPADLPSEMIDVNGKKYLQTAEKVLFANALSECETETGVDYLVLAPAGTQAEVDALADAATSLGDSITPF